MARGRTRLFVPGAPRNSKHSRAVCAESSGAIGPRPFADRCVGAAAKLAAVARAAARVLRANTSARGRRTPRWGFWVQSGAAFHGLPAVAINERLFEAHFRAAETAVNDGPGPSGTAQPPAKAGGSQTAWRRGTHMNSRATREGAARFRPLQRPSGCCLPPASAGGGRGQNVFCSRLQPASTRAIGLQPGENSRPRQEKPG